MNAKSVKGYPLENSAWKQYTRLDLRERTVTIRAVTFDFWRTLYRDTRSKERHRARIEALVEIGGVDPTRAKTAMKHTMEEFLRIHVYEQRTLQPADAIAILEVFLAEPLDPAVHDALSTAFAQAIDEHPPEPIDNALEAVRRTAEILPVGLISDTGISPGDALERILVRAGISDLFQVKKFSDRVGVAKPQAAMYETTAAALGCAASDLLHIGDLEPTDIAGALNVGARAALFAGDNTRFADSTRAHHTFHSWKSYLDQMDTLLNG